VHNFPPFAGEWGWIFNKNQLMLSVGLETRTRAIAAHPWSGCSRLASGVTAECHVVRFANLVTTDALGGAAPNPVFMAGVGRAVQWGQPLKALGVSLWHVSNPRLQRLSRCAGLGKP
jgi:hypothetical protein